MIATSPTRPSPAASPTARPARNSRPWAGRARVRDVQIDHAVLADFAEIVGGKLYLMGGGWDALRVNSLPASARLAVAVGIRIAWEETNRPVAVRITIEDDDGRELVRIDGEVNLGRPPDLPPGTSQLAQLAANMAVPINEAGGYRIRITAGAGDGAAERSLPFRVVRLAGATPGQP